MAVTQTIRRAVRLALHPGRVPEAARERWRRLEERALAGLAARLDTLGHRPMADTGERRPGEALATAGGLIDLAVAGATTALTPAEERGPSLRLRFQALLDASLAPRDDADRDEHPAFAGIVDQLVPDEALIVSLFAKRGHLPLLEVQAGTLLARDGQTVVEHLSGIGETVGARHPEHVPAYIENLCRLGLVRIVKPDPADSDLYELLEASPECAEARRRVADELKLTPKLRRRQARLTAFGRWFCDACSA